MTTNNVYIIIPAMNEASRIGSVVQGVKQLGYQNVIVVDDGSADGTGKKAREAGAEVIAHLVNLGAGAATKTGIEMALERGAEYLLTMDGDGQHFPEDVPRLIKVLVDHKVDCVLGSRFKEKNNKIPRNRILMNQVGNFITAIIAGLWVSDSQSGMKAFTADFARKLDFQFSGYEFCTEFIHLLHHNKASYREIPIKVHYSSETLEKGQSLKNGLKMILKFIREFG